MQSELIMIDPNELEIDLPVDPINVEIKKKSIQENGFGQSVTIWLYNGRIIDGFHRVVGAKEVGLKSIPCQVIDCTEDAFWDQRIQSARQHHRVEDDRLIVWMFESWKLTPWHKTGEKPGDEQLPEAPMSTLEKLLAQFTSKKKGKRVNVRRVDTNGDPLADMVKPLFDALFVKHTRWWDYEDSRTFEKFPAEEKELLFWLRKKATLWGIAPYDLIKRVLLWSKLGKTGHAEAKKYGLTFDQARELQSQTGGRIFSKPKKTTMRSREVVDAWVENELKATVGPVKPLHQFAAEYKAEQERQKHIETLRSAQSERTASGQAQAAKEKAEQNLEVVKNAIGRANASLCSARYIMRYVSETPVLLAQHMEATRQMILEFYPDSESLSEVNPIWLENIKLREQVAEQSAQIASLQRALGSKVNMNESFKAARALSSIEIEAQP